jgi:hypothetical protein
MRLHDRASMGRIGVLVAASALTLHCESAQDVEPSQLEELAPAFPYASWFAQHTGFEPVPDDFAAYAMLPISGTLYLGFGAGLPASADGALLGSFDDEGLRALAPLDEQGVLDMVRAAGMLFIPGVDPCCPDGWEAGNVYTYTTSGGLTKRRTLPNVLHAWGAWYDATMSEVYLATSAHRGDFTGSIGEIWHSADLGGHWDRIASDENGVGDYRTYDVFGHRGRLYATSADSLNSCLLVAQSAVGTDWTLVFPDDEIACYQRLTSFGDALIALDRSRSRLLVVSGQGELLRRELPFTVGLMTFHWATVAADRLYGLSDDGRILVTRDLMVWEPVVQADREFVTIQYWPQRDWLVLGSRGTDGALWKFRLCGAAPC